MYRVTGPIDSDSSLILQMVVCNLNSLVQHNTEISNALNRLFDNYWFRIKECDALVRLMNSFLDNNKLLKKCSSKLERKVERDINSKNYVSTDIFNIVTNSSMIVAFEEFNQQLLDFICGQIKEFNRNCLKGLAAVFFDYDQLLRDVGKSVIRQMEVLDNLVVGFKAMEKLFR